MLTDPEPSTLPSAAPKDAKKAARRSRLTRDQWIEAAIHFVAQHGFDALRLDVLANWLNVTKGSFYWHFADRDALLEAVLQTWRHRMTYETVAYLNLKAGTPLGRLKRLTRLAISPRPDVPGGPLELSLREWAKRDARVDAIVREVDAARIAVCRELYLGIGLSPEQASAYALAHMSFIVGGRQILFDGTQADLEHRWQLAASFLIPNIPPADP